MTGPIKPPGAPGASIPTPAADAVGKAGQVGKGEPGAFQETLATDAAQAAQVSGANASSVSASVAADLRSGSIDASQAVDRLVSEALESPMASSLNDAGRQALEVHLRESLTDDPSLASLVSDLDRGQ
ncbi:MAG: hypothetical protein ACI9KE_003158 [Polyangiales bacterium]|jgi:hypothetical protein